MKLTEIANILGGTLSGSDADVSGIGKIESARPGEITFISNPMYEKHFAATSAAAVIVSKQFNVSKHNREKKISLIIVDDPYQAFLTLLDKFYPQPVLQKPGIHSTAVISASASVPSDASIGAGVFIGENVSLGARCMLMPNVVLLDGVSLGDNVLLYPNITVYPACRLGSKVIIHSGTVIGSDGFGMAQSADGSFEKIPQRGIVVIGDDVEIGSNCSIDRATLGETVISNGVKLDNQIQIAHNVVIGENTVIAAHTGIAGSTKIGKNCLIGGKVGIVGHISICDNVTLTAATNVSKSITATGIYSGYRAQPMKDELKEQAYIRREAKRKT